MCPVPVRLGGCLGGLEEAGVGQELQSDRRRAFRKRNKGGVRRPRNTPDEVVVIITRAIRVRGEGPDTWVMKDA